MSSNWLRALAILSVAIVNLSSSILQAELEGPIEVDGPDELDALLREAPMAFVTFYSYTQRHGAWDQIKHSIQKVAQAMKEDNVPIQIFQINCDNYYKVVDRFGMTPYPGFKFYVYGPPREQKYLTAKVDTEIIPWLLKEYHQSSKLLETEEKIKKILKDHCHSIIYFGPDKTEKFKNYLHASCIFEDAAMFYHVFDPALIQKFGSPANEDEKQNGKIIFYEDFGKEQFDYYPEVYDADTIKDFISHNMHHGAYTHDFEHHKKITDEHVPSLVVVVGDDAQSKKARKAFEEAAPALKRKILYSIADWLDPDFVRYYGLMDLKKEEMPTAYIFSFNEDYRPRYRYKGHNITTQGIIDFYWQWKNKTIKPLILDVYRSKNAPKNETGPVKVTKFSNI